MNPVPYFSFIIPVYNRALEIEKCLLSILKQSFLDYEIIVINDGSLDNTAEIIEYYKLKYTPTIKLINYSDNKGVNYARNRGIENSRGIFLFFLDSDDVLLNSNSLSNVKHCIDENPNYVHYLFRVSDRENDRKLPFIKHEFQFRDWLIGKIEGDFVCIVKPICFQKMLFVEEFRIYESLNWLRVLKRNKVQFYVPVTVVERDRNRKDSATNEYLLKSRSSLLNTYKFINIYAEWYYEEFVKLDIVEKLLPEIKRGILIGIALKENKKNEALLMILEKYYQKKTLIRLLNYPLFGKLVFILIILKSKYNHYKIKL